MDSITTQLSDLSDAILAMNCRPGTALANTDRREIQSAMDGLRADLNALPDVNHTIGRQAVIASADRIIGDQLSGLMALAYRKGYVTG